MRRLTKVFKTLASGAMASAAALALVLPSAAALPPGGAEGSTEGTSSTVTGSVEAGGTLSFSLSGFPAGETVSIKIDDGALDGSDNSVSGTGVVHQQKIGANGSVSGSFVLPSYVKPGTHWLRFLASQDIPESQGGGTKGFTNRSPQFTVTGPASDSGEQGGAGGAAGSNEAAGSGSAGSGAGGSVAGGNGTGAGAAGGGAGSAGAAGGAPGAGTNSGVGAGSQAAPSAGASAKATSGTLKVTASPNAKKKSQPAATTVTTIVAVGQISKPAFPVLGVSVFAAAVLIGAAAIGAVLLRNRRQAGAAGAGLAGAAGAAAAGGGAANSAGAGAAGASAAGAGAGKSAGAGGVGNFPGPAA